MKSFLLLPAIALIAVMNFSTANGNIIVTDDFESGSFSSDFTRTNNATINTTAGTGADGTSNFVELAGGGGNLSLGAAFGNVPDAYVDFFVRSDGSANREFNFQFGASDVSANVNTNSASLNLRFEDGNWDAFLSGTWNEIGGLTPLTADEWHRVRVTANDWGTATPTFDVQVSAAGANTFNSSATGLTFLPTFGAISTTANGVQSFNFNNRFGSGDGFDIDQVTAVVVTAVPEPASASLVALGLVGLMARRKRS